jgi:hypothetical protein
MVKGGLINVLRRIVDKHDEKNGLKEKQVFMCTSMERRNEYRREGFRIDMEQPQCPVFKDNRCCGGCDLAPTCEYATACNCYGFTKGALGGTDEGYYMRVADYAKYGRIDENGKFDWDTFKLNQTKEQFVPGKFVVIKEVKHSSLEEDIVTYLKENEVMIAQIKEEVQDNGLVLVDFAVDNQGKSLEVLINFQDVNYRSVYETVELAKRFGK